MRPRPEPREAANTAPRAALTAFSTSGFQTLAPRIGCNPEQLFAAAWSASLESAIALAARQRKIIFPVGLAIEAEVDLCLADGAYFLHARLNVNLPGVGREVAQVLVDEAHQTCAYSKAIRGYIDVVINLV